MDDLREYLVANMLDGDDGGLLTMKVSALMDEVVELVKAFLEDKLEVVQR